jgi:cytochrome c553
VLATLMVLIHIGLIAFDCLAAEQVSRNFSCRQFIQRDLERPLFEPYGFCGGWVHYTAAQGIALGLNFPAYIGVTTLQSAVSSYPTCVETATTPRGQFLTLAFVFPLWFTVGSSLRRLARRSWRRPATTRWWRAVLFFGVILIPLGVMSFAPGVVGLLVSEVSIWARLFGLAFWSLYIGMLSAERLRLWPFRSICESGQETWGDGSSIECSSCHGSGYKGKDDVPGIAGRSPVSLMRQLYDFKSGARRGGKSKDMDKVVKYMTNRDMLALSAYLGSLTP